MHFPQIHGKGWGITSPSKAPPLGELAGASPTERARLLTANPSHSDSIALTKSLPIAAPAALSCRACPLRHCFAMPLPGLRLPASASLPLASCWPRPQQLLPVSATGGGRRRCSQRERLWQAASFPVSFWRKEWYNGFAALPAHLFGRGGEKNGKYSFFYTVCRSKCSSLLYLQVA